MGDWRPVITSTTPSYLSVWPMEATWREGDRGESRLKGEIRGLLEGKEDGVEEVEEEMVE